MEVVKNKNIKIFNVSSSFCMAQYIGYLLLLVTGCILCQFDSAGPQDSSGLVLSCSNLFSNFLVASSL